MTSSSCLTDSSPGFASSASAAAAMSSAVSAASSVRTLITDLDHQSVELCLLQLFTHLVELIEVADGTYAHAVPHVGVDGHALHDGLHALHGELGAHAFGFGFVAVGAGLHHVHTGTLDLGGRRQIAFDVLVLLRHHHFEVGQHLVEVILRGS